MKRSLRAVHSDQEGASAVLVVLSIFVLLGAAALAVDAGSLWMTKRSFVADTDAAALAGAMAAAELGCDESLDASNPVRQEALEYLAHNQGGSVSGAPVVDPDCTDDTVTVEFTGQAPMTFAGVLGFSQLDVFSSSTAEFDFDPQGQLRPIATCIGNPLVTAASVSPPTDLESAPAIVTQLKNENGKGTTSDLASCGSQPGNWGWLCLDSNCGNKDSDPACEEPDGFRAFMRCGYDPGLDVGVAPTDGSPPLYAAPYDDQDEDCYDDGGPSDWCMTKTGSLGGSLDGPFDAALEQRVFPIIVIDRWLETKPGQTEVHPKALLWVRMDGWCLHPNNSYEPVDEWNDAELAFCSSNTTAFKMAPLFVQWSADDELPDFILQHVPAEYRLCGVDSDPSGGNRC